MNYFSNIVVNMHESDCRSLEIKELFSDSYSGLYDVNINNVHYLVSSAIGNIAKIERVYGNNVYYLTIAEEVVSNYDFIKSVDKFICNAFQEQDFTIIDNDKRFNSFIELLLYLADIINSNIQDEMSTYYEVETDTLLNNTISIEITSDFIE